MIRMIEQSVGGGNGSSPMRIRFDPNETSYVKVTWGCGEARQFRPEELRGLVYSLDALYGFTDVVLDGKDAYHNSFAVRIEGNNFMAGTVPSDVGGSVPWDELRRVVMEMTVERVDDDDDDEDDEVEGRAEEGADVPF